MPATTIGRYATVEEFAALFEMACVDGETQLHWKINRAANARKGTRAGAPLKTKMAKTEYRRIGFTDKTGCERSVLEHVVIYALRHGRWPILELDHKDGNGLNNHPDNLREATSAQNKVNRTARSDSALGIKGVRQKKGRHGFSTQFLTGKVEGVQKYETATFNNPEDASAWYQSKAREAHGEFAHA